MRRKHRSESRPYRGPLRAVILDWSGTTVDCGCRALPRLREALDDALAFTLGQTQGWGRWRHWPINPIDELQHQCCSDAPPSPQTVALTHFQRTLRRLAPTVMADSAIPIPGTIDLVASLQRAGIRIGSTSEYRRDLLAAMLRTAAQHGYRPEVAVSASDVPECRPAPYLCSIAAHMLGSWPPESCVNVGDTPADMLAGRYAGMWTIGVSMTGRQLGMSPTELSTLSRSAYRLRRDQVTQALVLAGAHYVVDSVAEIAPCIDDIQRRLRLGDRPVPTTLSWHADRRWLQHVDRPESGSLQLLTDVISRRDHRQ